MSIFSKAMEIDAHPVSFYPGWSRLFNLMDQLEQEVCSLPAPKSGIYLQSKDLLNIISNTKQLLSTKVIDSIKNLLPGSII